MKKTLEFLKQCGPFFVATEDGDQARVRPFGAVHEFEGKLYICTNNQKPCYQQMIANPKIEICGMNKDGRWIRVTAEAVRDDRDEARHAALEAAPSLRSMYSEGDGIFEVLYLKNAKSVISSFTAAPETEEF
ncbi:MAG: pyridoxamine 5'-phosphate oxidase family protein [Oscillospiraceae bacterium]|nr:pyridoxamine 5'-phosphate oxidase family protein [Oscillospiraceae bacterium]